MAAYTLIRAYYDAFNTRRFADAEALFAEEAVLDMPPFTQHETGVAGYRQFIQTWLRAFPDAQFQLVTVEQRNETICEVQLVATGTHTGPLDLSTYGVVAPSHVRLTLQARELLEFHRDRIRYAGLAIDLHHLVRELTRIDYDRVISCLATIRDLSDALATVRHDRQAAHDVLSRLARALDAARHAIRPQFNR